MAIVCNSRCLNSPLTGAQRYTSKILAGFPEAVRLMSPGARYSRGMRGHLWEQAVLPFKVNGNLLWSPSNSGPLACKRQVVTLHDVVSMDHPEWFNKTYADWYKYLLPKLCRQAAHIITISEFTRERILEWFDVPDTKISVVYNGVDHDLAEIHPEVPPLKLPFERYVLSLGSLEPRKNIPLLLKAWRKIGGRIPDDIGLVIVGGAGSSRIFKSTDIDTGQNRVYFTGHVSDAHITHLFKNTMLFVYISLYEGFGLPPLEAMAAGIPVLTSNLTSLPEVVGDGGVMIDPYSQTQCEIQLVRLINSEHIRSRLASQAILQAIKFDWKESALKTWNILQQFS